MVTAESATPTVLIKPASQISANNNGARITSGRKRLRVPMTSANRMAIEPIGRTVATSFASSSLICAFKAGAPLSCQFPNPSASIQFARIITIRS